jgi:glycine C-acetyltransferase/8-amino-7-oxononanoate synthase
MKRPKAIATGMEGPPGAHIIFNGHRYLYFGGTGYFGLHGHRALVRAGIRAFLKYGSHGATSRAGFGSNPVLIDVEARLREFFGEDDAVYFGSGYLGSLLLVQALAEKYEAVFIDENAHFSIRDAAASSGKPVRVFRHRDPDDLFRKLRAGLKAGQRPLVLTDGVFPVSGRIAPARDYTGAVAAYDGVIGLDDAHGAGVLGDHGRGTYEHFRMRGPRFYLVGTLSKSFGGHGGFAVGTRGHIGRIRAAGAYIGSTPTPTPIAAASAKGIEILLRHPEMRDRLRRNTARLKKGLRKLGLAVEDTPVPIATLFLRTEREMRGVQKELLRRGIAVPYLKYAGAPPAGTLRLAVFSTHTPAQIQRLLSELARVL